jgi:hypothetical protein
MVKTLTGWTKEHTRYNKGALAHYKEEVSYGKGVIADCIFSEFGEYFFRPGNQVVNEIPAPPAGVDWTVVFIQNNTVSAAGDLVLQGAETTSGTFAILKDDLIDLATSTAGGTSIAAIYTQQPGLTPTGGRMPVMRFFQDDDGLHSTTTGTNKTAEVHLYWVIP